MIQGKQYELPPLVTYMTSQYHFPEDLEMVARAEFHPQAAHVAVRLEPDRLIPAALSEGFHVAYVVEAAL